MRKHIYNGLHHIQRSFKHRNDTSSLQTILSWNLSSLSASTSTTSSESTYLNTPNLVSDNASTDASTTATFSSKVGYSSSSRGSKIATDEGVSSTSQKSTPAREQSRRALLIKKVWHLRLQSDVDNILRIAKEARLHNVDLDSNACMSVLWACEQVTDIRAEEGFWIYDLFKQGHAIPLMAFERVMRICAKRGNGIQALSVLDEFQSRQNELTLPLLSDLLKAICTSQRKNFEVELDHYYRLLRQLAKEKSWRPDIGLYVTVAKGFSRWGTGEDVLRVLRHMTSDDYEPPSTLCDELIEKALTNFDVNVIRVLAPWYLNIFESPLSRGVTSRIMQVASASGDISLAQIGLQLMTKYNYPATASDYECLANACMASCDYAGTVEALLQAERVLKQEKSPADADINSESISTEAVPSSSSTNTNSIQSIESWNFQEGLAFDLSKSVQRLDAFYYSLVDLVRKSSSVPKVALNAVIMAAGRTSLDRSFATFQEHTSLFGVRPDINTYNALIYAASQSRHASVRTVLSIFEEMEEAGVIPNGLSLSILLEVMAESNDLQGLDELLAHARTLPASELKQRSLRRIAVACSKQGEWEKVKLILSMMPVNNIPPFFRERIESLKEKDVKNSKLILFGAK